jgi:hypothetical protein
MKPTCLRGVALLVCLLSAAAGAHSASDAYLTLEAVGTGAAAAQGAAAGAVIVVHGQWDIALRDLDFVLKLDDDGDGRITWGELRRHQAEIARYATARLSFTGGRGATESGGLTGGAGGPCSLRVTRQQVDGHADGAYAALFFDVLCARRPAALQIRYNLFFAVDPSHRGILVMHSGDELATAVLAPENATINLPL